MDSLYRIWISTEMCVNEDCDQHGHQAPPTKPFTNGFNQNRKRKWYPPLCLCLLLILSEHCRCCRTSCSWWCQRPSSGLPESSQKQENVYSNEDQEKATNEYIKGNENRNRPRYYKVFPSRSIVSALSSTWNDLTFKGLSLPRLKWSTTLLLFTRPTRPNPHSLRRRRLYPSLNPTNLRWSQHSSTLLSKTRQWLQQIVLLKLKNYQFNGSRSGRRDGHGNKYRAWSTDTPWSSNLNLVNSQ